METGVEVMEYDMAKFMLRHPEAVVCEKFIVAAVKHYDSSIVYSHESAVVGYHVVGFSDGYLRRYLSPELHPLYEDACYKVREYARVSLKESLSQLGKKRVELERVTTVPPVVEERGTLEEDQERLKTVREVMSRLEEQLDKLEA